MSGKDDDRASLTRRLYGDLDRSGVRAAIETLCAPDVVLVDIPDFPGGGEHRGREAVIRHLEEFNATWAGWTLEVREVIERGDHVGVRFLLSLTGRSSGAPTEFDMWHVYSYRGEQAVRVEAHAETEAALAALAR